MGLQFFGQFLISRGEIDSSQLRAGLDLMESKNQTLGELAVEAGFALPAECRRVNGEQRRLDRPFGELAVEMGVLDSIELEELLQKQQETRMNISDALISLEYTKPDRIAALEDLFKREQADHKAGKPPLPEALQGIRVAECLIDLLPRYCNRMARLEVKLDAGERLTEPDRLELVASLGMMGNPGVKMVLCTDRTFARQLAAGISGLPADGLSDELCLDAVGEFLNVLGGNVMSMLESEGQAYRLEAPRFNVPPVDGWRFEIAAQQGEAAFLLAPR
jgi:CheY-specific phosphatase CheX